MKTLRTEQAGKVSAAKPTATSLGTTEEGLHFCAWDMSTAMTNRHAATGSATSTTSRFAMGSLGTAMANSLLTNGNRECILLPSLSVFNMNTRLYFADCWSFYDKHYVTLVLCPKGSPCQQVCKQQLCKLNPYKNSFLFRNRNFDPEPSVAVYTSASINVEVIYSTSAKIHQLISACSQNVYFCKVRVVDR